MTRQCTYKLSLALDRAVFETERKPGSLFWFIWRWIVEWYIFGGTK